MGVSFCQAGRSATFSRIATVSFHHFQLPPPASQFHFTRNVRPLPSMFGGHAPPLHDAHLWICRDARACSLLMSEPERDTLLADTTHFLKLSFCKGMV